MQIYANKSWIARGMIWWLGFELWITSFLFGKPIKKKQAMLNMLKIMLIFLTLSLERLMRNFFFFFFKTG
jgi:hypothetical protein